jgi:hypothetical protein
MLCQTIDTSVSSLSSQTIGASSPTKSPVHSSHRAVATSLLPHVYQCRPASFENLTFAGFSFPLLPWGFAFPVKDVPFAALVMTICWFILGFRSDIDDCFAVQCLVVLVSSKKQNWLLPTSAGRGPLLNINPLVEHAAETSAGRTIFLNACLLR